MLIHVDFFLNIAMHLCIFYAFSAKIIFHLIEEYLSSHDIISDDKTPPPLFFYKKQQRNEIEIRARNSSFFRFFYTSFLRIYILSNFSSYFTSTSHPVDIFKTRSWSTAGQRAIPLNFARDHVSATEICATLKKGNTRGNGRKRERE